MMGTPAPHPLAGGDLRPHDVDRLGRWAHPGGPGVLDGAGEGRIPRRGIRNRDGLPQRRALRRVDHSLLDEVALRGAVQARAGTPRRRHARATSGDPPPSRRRRRDPELPQRAEDPNRNLATVGDEHLREAGHDGHIVSLWGPADQLTVARMGGSARIVALFAIDFDGHEYWATALFAIAMATDWVDGWLARRSGSSSAMGSPSTRSRTRSSCCPCRSCCSAKALRRGSSPRSLRGSSSSGGSGWLRSSAASSSALGSRKLKTGTQSIAAILGGLAVAGAIDESIAWWALVVALVVTWVSGLDYARLAPRLLRSLGLGRRSRNATRR